MNPHKNYKRTKKIKRFVASIRRRMHSPLSRFFFIANATLERIFTNYYEILTEKVVYCPQFWKDVAPFKNLLHNAVTVYSIFEYFISRQKKKLIAEWQRTRASCNNLWAIFSSVCVMHTRFQSVRRWDERVKISFLFLFPFFSLSQR